MPHFVEAWRRGFDNNWKDYGSIHCWKWSFWLLSFSSYVSLLLCLYCLSVIPIFPLHKVLSFDCKCSSTSLPYEDHNQKVHKLRYRTPLHSNHKSNGMDWCFWNLSMRYTPWLSSISIHYSSWSRYSWRIHFPLFLWYVVYAPGSPPFLPHARQTVSYIGGLIALRLSFFMGYE